MLRLLALYVRRSLTASPQSCACRQARRYPHARHCAASATCRHRRPFTSLHTWRATCALVLSARCLVRVLCCCLHPANAAYFIRRLEHQALLCRLHTGWISLCWKGSVSNDRQKLMTAALTWERTYQSSPQAQRDPGDQIDCAETACAQAGVRRGERILQLTFGAGFKGAAAVWRAVRDVRCAHPAWA